MLDNFSVTWCHVVSGYLSLSRPSGLLSSAYFLVIADGLGFSHLQGLASPHLQSEGSSCLWNFGSSHLWSLESFCPLVSLAYEVRQWSQLFSCIAPKTILKHYVSLHKFLGKEIKFLIMFKSLKRIYFPVYCIWSTCFKYILYYSLGVIVYFSSFVYLTNDKARPHCHKNHLNQTYYLAEEFWVPMMTILVLTNGGGR